MTAPTRSELEQELRHLQTKLVELEGAIERMHPETKRSRRWTLAACATVATAVLGVSGALAADGACPNGLPLCFAANARPRGSELNQNFAQLLAWLEDKAGPVESKDLTSLGNVQLAGGDGQQGVETPSDTLYSRSAKGFAWYRGGSHDPNAGNAGGGSKVLALDGTNPQEARLTIGTPNGALGASQDFVFHDVGDNWLRLRNGANTAYGDLAVRDQWIDGTLYFTREGCHQILANGVWAVCPDGHFVAGIDYDHNRDGVGGVYCCRL